MMQDVENFSYAGFARRSQAVKIGPTNQNCVRAKGKSFQNIGSPADTAIDQHRHTACHFFRHRG